MKSLLIIGLLITSVLTTTQGADLLSSTEECSIEVHRNEIIKLQNYSNKLHRIANELNRNDTPSFEAIATSFKIITDIKDELSVGSEDSETEQIHNGLSSTLESMYLETKLNNDEIENIPFYLGMLSARLLRRIDGKIFCLNHIINNSEQSNTTIIDSAPPLLLPPPARPIHPIFNGAMWGKR